ncbi:MAG: ferritin [Candidatus Melainabacteria bacterium]|nr:MAG: ferritin [Candidatus Melainabacteria bacterium]
MQSPSHCADKLNGLLKGEIAAVETYEQALEKITNPDIRLELEDVQQCHADRAGLLTRTVASMGKEPTQGGGPWGAFAKLIEGGAKVFGEKAAIGVLEEGEDKGLADYRKLQEDSDPIIHSIVKELLPRQEETHAKMSSLKQRLH